STPCGTVSSIWNNRPLPAPHSRHGFTSADGGRLVFRHGMAEEITTAIVRHPLPAGKMRVRAKCIASERIEALTTAAGSEQRRAIGCGVLVSGHSSMRAVEDIAFKVIVRALPPIISHTPIHVENIVEELRAVRVAAVPGAEQQQRQVLLRTDVNGVVIDPGVL